MTRSLLCPAAVVRRAPPPAMRVEELAGLGVQHRPRDVLPLPGRLGSPVTTATDTAYDGDAVQVVDRAVDRVDDPREAAGPGGAALLLAEDAVVGPLRRRAGG